MQRTAKFPRRKPGKPPKMKISTATLRGYRHLFGGKIPAGAMEAIRKAYAKNPGGPGAFERCVKEVAAKGGAYSPRGVCASAGRKKYGKAKFQRMAAAGKARAKKTRSNPEGAAAERYEYFHGKAPEEVIEITTPIHEHTVLSGIGKLRRLVILAVDGVTEVTLDGFKGALLAQDEKGRQLFIEGGDQSVNLPDFGLSKKHAHEQELLGAVTDVVYFTDKRHLQPEDGGLANYAHPFGKRRVHDANGDRHVPIIGARLPVAIYDVRNKLIKLAGGTYDLPEVGIRG